MIIKKDERLLVLRIGEYKKYSFIDEHANVIRKHGFVWMLKLGKAIPNGALDNTIGINSVVLLREPKRVGGKLFLCKCTEYRNGEVLPNYLFPTYYEEMFSEYYWLSSSGTWLCLTSIIPLDEEYYDTLVMAQSGKPLIQVLNETRTSMMYVKNTIDIHY